MKHQAIMPLWTAASLALFCGLNETIAQTNRIPNHDSPSVYEGIRPDVVVYEDGDFDPPPAGQVLMAHWRNLQKINQKIGTDLQNAPDNATGKQSPAYPSLQAWKTQFNHFISTKAVADLFALVPGMESFHSLPEEQISSAAMRNVRGRMTEVIYYVVEELATKIEQSNGALNAADLAKAVVIFSNGSLYDHTQWDPPEEPMPVDAPGVMILDAASVVTQLKAAPWQRTKEFIGGYTTADEYFDRYTGNGNRLASLKSKYAANKQAIDAKFNELKTWADQQEQQAVGGN